MEYYIGLLYWNTKFEYSIGAFYWGTRSPSESFWRLLEAPRESKLLPEYSKTSRNYK